MQQWSPAMSKPLHWRELVLPTVVAPSAMRAVLVGLAGLPGQPRLVLEATSDAGRLRHRLGADDDLALRRAIHVARTHMPDVVVVTAPAVDDDSGPQQPKTKITKTTNFFDATSTSSGINIEPTLTVAAQVRISRSRQLPLGADDTDAAVRAVLGALAQTRRGEQLRLQLVLGSRTHPTLPPSHDAIAGGRAAPLKAATVQRAEQPGFGCALRIAAVAGTSARAHSLVSQVGAALQSRQAPGVRVSLSRVSPRSVAVATSPFLWPLWLSVSDLTTLTGWPVGSNQDAALPGIRPRHPRLLPALPVHAKGGRGAVVYGDSVDAFDRLDRADHGHRQTSGRQRQISQPVPDTLQHRHILGPTGVGKSTLLGNLVLQDAAAGRGGVVIDPKGDLVDDLLARIPESRAGDVVVLDAASTRPVGFNPLQSIDPNLAADGILAVFHSLHGDGLGPRSSDILHAASLTLARRGDASLVLLPVLLTNPGFRRSVVGSVASADPMGLGAFWAGFEAMSLAERDAATRPLLNKLRPILLRPSLRAVFGQRRPAISIEEIIAGNKLLLVRLGKDRIGAEAAQLLGSLIVAQLWQAILGRSSVPAAQRVPFMVTIDEVQDYLRLPGSLADALAQARGLGVAITAAHQHRGQLARLVDDLDANTATKVVFRLTGRDAHSVARDHAGGVLEAADLTALPAFHAYLRPLVHGSLAPWVSLRTRPLPPPLRDPRLLQAASEARYGQTLTDIERDLLSLLDTRASPAQGASSDTFGRRRHRDTSTTETTDSTNSDDTPSPHQKGGTP